MSAQCAPSLASVRARIVALKRSQRFVPWRYSSELADDLRELLGAMKRVVEDPRQGAELMAAFYETDRNIFDHCDDSSGYVGDVYRFDAQELFVRFGKACEDKEWLVHRVFGLIAADDYGVRDALLEAAPRYLPKAQIRGLVARMREADAALPEDKRGYKWRVDIEILARAMKDGALFAEARLSYPGPLHSSTCVDIAGVYFSAGQAETALEWLEKTPLGDHTRDRERDELLFKVYAALGARESQESVAWRIFRRDRNLSTLEQLLALAGQSAREKIVHGEVSVILADTRFDCADAQFLVDAGRGAEAEDYLMARAGLIDGEHYYGLLPLSESMLGAGHPLAATVVYRALLDSILKRARSKIYGHAASYLRNLERISGKIMEWKGLPDHPAYLASLQSKHARKSAFWSRCAG
ncbi:MAG: hypothetical protein FGM15_13615 [Chthoniobacterales bacterium]|nr:hypothetical protein [Chthoniobacterales bacterium]